MIVKKKPLVPRKGTNPVQVLERERLAVSQADRVIEKFGGARALMRALKLVGYELNPSSIYRWTYTKENGGTGGLIPTAAWDKIVKVARMIGVFLTEEDFDPRPTLRETRRVLAIRSPDGTVRPFLNTKEIKRLKELQNRVNARIQREKEEKLKKDLARKAQNK